MRDAHSSGGQTGVSFVHSRRANEEVALNIKANPEVKGRSNATKRIISAGEICADGAMIELVSGSSALNKPDLLLWNGRKAFVGPRIEHGGRTFEATELAPSLYWAMRLPSKCTDYGSARGLFAGISDLFKHHLDLPERESSLLTCFSISTWLADRLPSAPILAISGPSQELGVDVLRLLSCVCRHPLMLVEVTPVGFRSLPTQVSLTLLLDQQELKPNMQRLFRASIYVDCTCLETEEVSSISMVRKRSSAGTTLRSILWVVESSTFRWPHQNCARPHWMKRFNTTLQTNFSRAF